jgi:hypothetical protein
MRTSAATGEGLDELFLAVAAAALEAQRKVAGAPVVEVGGNGKDKPENDCC